MNDPTQNDLREVEPKKPRRRLDFADRITEIDQRIERYQRKVSVLSEQRKSLIEQQAERVKHLSDQIAQLEERD